MLFLYAVICGVMAAGLAFCLNWWALRPWRRSTDAHWTERARILFPIRVGANSNVILLPLIFMIACMHSFENKALSMPVLAITTFVATILATYPLTKEISPWISFRPWVKEVAGSWTLLLGRVLIFLLAGILIPEEFSLYLWLWFLLFVAFLAYLNWHGLMPILGALGIVREAPESLVRMVDRVSSRMQIKVERVWLWQSANANALALPPTGELLFSTRLLDTMTEPEQEAICAHELGHLSESRSVVAMRILGGVSAAPLVLSKPLVHSYGAAGLAILLLSWLALHKLFNKTARKMEERADAVAVSDSDGLLYAKALEKIYELNQMPAVMTKDNMVHPHLYDRLLAVGITPDYPRPAAPKACTDATRLLQIAFAFFLIFSVIHKYF